MNKLIVESPKHESKPIKPEQVWINLYHHGRMAGERRDSLSIARDSLAGARGGIILCITRTADGDFLIKKEEEF